MYLKDLVDVLKEQSTVLYRAKYILFRSIGRSTRTDGKRVQTEPMPSSFFHEIYKATRQRMISNTDDTVVCIDKNNAHSRSVIRFLQIFSNNTASTLSSSKVLPYPIHVLFLNTIP